MSLSGGLATYIPSDRRLRVLEVGCGPGRNLDYLPDTIDYTGCDLSAKDRGENIRTIEGYADLLRQTFRDAEGHELSTDMIIYPTSACVIRSGHLAT
jgi:SAM-dependent methyltransferase